MTRMGPFRSCRPTPVTSVYDEVQSSLVISLLFLCILPYRQIFGKNHVVVFQTHEIGGLTV